MEISNTNLRYSGIVQHEPIFRFICIYEKSVYLNNKFITIFTISLKMSSSCTILQPIDHCLFGLGSVFRTILFPFSYFYKTS